MWPKFILWLKLFIHIFICFVDSASFVSLGRNEWESTGLRFSLSFWLFTHVWCTNNAGLLLDCWIACSCLMSLNCLFGVFTSKHLSKQKKDGAEGKSWAVSERWSDSSQCPFQCSVFSPEPHAPQCPLSYTKPCGKGTPDGDPHPALWFLCSASARALLWLTVLSATPHHQPQLHFQIRLLMKGLGQRYFLHLCKPQWQLNSLRKTLLKVSLGPLFSSVLIISSINF